MKSSYSNGMVDPPKQARNANVATGGLPVDNQKLRGITEWAGTFSVPCRRWTASRSTTAVRFAPPRFLAHRVIPETRGGIIIGTFSKGAVGNCRSADDAERVAVKWREQ